MIINKKKKINVLITGAGGSATEQLVAHLRQENRFNIILSDIKPIFGIDGLADKFVRVPMAHDENYLAAIKEIIHSEQLDAIIPGVDEELLRFIEFRKQHHAPRIIMPASNFVSLTLDKLELNKTLKSKGIQVPETFHIKDLEQIPSSFFKKKTIAKPIQGRGSRGVYIIESEKEARTLQPYLMLKQPESIFQEFIEGTEYTVSVIASTDGKLLAVIPKRVILKRGITIEAVTEKNQAIIEYCSRIVDMLNPSGPFNVQLVLDRKRQPQVFEINPRFSTTTILTSESGISEIAISVYDALGELYQLPSWDENVRLVRKWTNYFERVKS